MMWKHGGETAQYVLACVYALGVCAEQQRAGPASAPLFYTNIIFSEDLRERNLKTLKKN